MPRIAPVANLASSSRILGNLLALLVEEEHTPTNHSVAIVICVQRAIEPND